MSRTIWIAASLVLVLIVGGVAILRDGGERRVPTCESVEGPSALLGIDPESGAVLWERSAAYANRAVVVGATIAAVGPEGIAQGIDVATGDVLWCHELGAVNRPKGNIVNPEFVSVGDVVATMAVGGDLAAFDTRSGLELWRVQAGDLEGAQTWSNDGLIYVNGIEAEGGAWQAFEPDTGRLVEALNPPRVGAIVSGRLELTSSAGNEPGRQLVQLLVSEVTTGDQIWSARVPGFRASLIGDVVVVIDQTAGTGIRDSPGSASTSISAYEAGTGVPLWRVAAPGLPQRVFGVGSLAIVPNGSEVLAIDQASGQIEWQVDNGSPGVDRFHSQAGSYRYFASTDNPEVIVGLIVAEQEYHD